MRYQYYICDVFTNHRFGGNQLAVLPQATGLSDHQMQQIAREFNFSESTFVFPAEMGHSRKVRIFSPTSELPFAGHPNIGTAYVLAAAGEFGRIATSITVTFEEKAGLVPVLVQRRAGNSFWCELQAPEMLSLGQTASPRSLASAVSLQSNNIVTSTHFPQVASVGLPFLFAELTSSATLGQARIFMDELDALVAGGVAPNIFLYAFSKDEFDVRARMFAPLDGVPEDPATGSANCALAGLLSHYNEKTSGIFHWRIAQGVEMGRSSILEARSEKRKGEVVATWVGGNSILVGEGFIETDSP